MSPHRITRHGPDVARDRIAGHVVAAVDDRAQVGVRLRVEDRRFSS